MAQVIHAIDDPAPELAIGGSGSERAMFFECSRRKSEKLGRVWRPELFRSGQRVEIRTRMTPSPASRMSPSGQQGLSARLRAAWRTAAASRARTEERREGKKRRRTGE